MSLNGHDLAVHLRRSRFLELIQAHVRIDGQPLVAPLRLKREAERSGVVQALRPLDLVIGSVDVRLEPGTERGWLVFGIEAGVVRLPDSADLRLSAGALELAFEHLPGNLFGIRPLRFEFDAAVLRAAAGTPDFRERVAPLLASLLGGDRGRQFHLFPIPGNARPEQTELHVAVLPGRCWNVDAETVGVMVGEGTAPISRLMDEPYDIALGIGADQALEHMILPRLAQALLGPDDWDVRRLPKPHGNGEVVRQVDGTRVVIKRLHLSFADGHINLDVGFSASGKCWSVEDGSYSQKLLLTLGRNGRLVPRFEPEVPDVKATPNIDWLCKVGIVALGTILSSFAWGVGALIAAELVVGSVKAPGDGAPPPELSPLPSLEGTVWSDFRVTPEGFFTRGHVRASKPAPAPAPRVALDVGHLPEPIGAQHGVVEVQLPSCRSRTFAYDETGQIDHARLDARPWLLIEPIEYEWRIDGTRIDRGASTIRLKKNVRTPLPPPVGTVHHQHDVEIACKLGRSIDFGTGIGIADASPRTLHLTPRQGDANYSIVVGLRAVDAAGRAFNASGSVGFAGLVLEMGDDYETHLNDCLNRTVDSVEAKNIPRHRAGPPIPDDRLNDALERVRSVVTTEPARALDLMENLARTHGGAALNKAFERLA